MSRPSLLFLLPLLVVLTPLAGSAQSLGGAPYTNSWLGNTYGLPEEHIPHTIENLYVTPSGLVATICGWDEGGHNAALYSASGAALGFPEQSGTGSWGRNSGKAVFVDDSYLYQVMSQNGRDGASSNPDHYPQDTATVWKCIRRYNHNGDAAPFSGGKGYDGSMLIVSADSSETMPTGVLVYGNELYVSDSVAGNIKVYNATTLSATPVRTFSVVNPGLLDHDRLGLLWMLDVPGHKLIRFAPDGTLQPQVILLDPGIIPTAFCVDKVNDRILLANNGDDQNILIYSNILTTPTLTDTFGTTGGINSGTVGLIAPLKFCEPKGVGIDSSGNIFVANNSLTGGAYLEKYNATGTLLWRLNGLVFTAVGETNPANESEFYTPEFKFNLDLTQTAPGREWSPAAMTLNRVKYPGDPRILIPGQNDSIRSTAFVRTIGGKKLLYVTDMYGGFLAVYRFNFATDGETAIPSGLFDGTDLETLWIDTNGNGANDAGETQSKPADNIYAQHHFPDAQGGVWKANREQGLRYFPLQGFDTHGNPIYTYASSVVHTLPEIADARRAVYDATNDVLYAAGASSNGILGGDWGTAGDRLVRYNDFLGTRTTAWSIALPFRPNSPNEGNVKGFCEAGDYLFLAAYRLGRIYVHRKSDGTKVGEILPTADTGNTSGWSDIMSPILATRRANGEYLIFAEENGFGKIMMYRWDPLATLPPSLRLPGAPIGTADSWNNLGDTLERALDGDPATFFDAPMPDGAWVGLDLGDPRFVAQVRFHPRSGQTGRMVGGRFQGSSTADFSSGVVDLFTIDTVPLVGWNTITLASPAHFRYLRYLSPNGSWGNIAELEFLTSPLAAFRTTHSLPADGSADLATPAGDGVANLLKYAFNLTGSGPAQASTLTTPHSPILAPDGSAGLPFVTTEPSTGKLQLTYIRRKATTSSGITYTAEFASDLTAPSSWSTNPAATETITSLDATWERVTVSDSTVFTRRFARLKVTVP